MEIAKIFLVETSGVFLSKYILEQNLDQTVYDCRGSVYRNCYIRTESDCSVGKICSDSLVG